MPTYWNFRTILSVEPTTDTCAALTQKGERCRKPLNPGKRREARRLLDEMDREKEVATRKFKDLAEELLCKEVHNSEKRYWLNQVEEVSHKWEIKFENQAKKAKLKRTQSIVRQRPKADPVLDKLEAVLVEIDVMKTKMKARAAQKLISVRNSKVDQAGVLSTTTVVTSESGADDPFTTNGGKHQEKPTDFEETLRHISEMKNIEDGELLQKGASYSSAGVHEEHDQSSKSEVPLPGTDFPSVPDLLHETKIQKDEDPKPPPPILAFATSTQLLAVRDIDFKASGFPSKGQVAPRKQRPTSSTTTTSTTAKLSNCAASIGASEENMPAFTFDSSSLKLATPSNVKADLPSNVPQSSPVNTTEKPSLLDSRSAKVELLVSDLLPLNEPMVLAPTPEQESVSILNPSISHKTSFATLPETPQAPAPPSPTDISSKETNTRVNSPTKAVPTDDCLPVENFDFKIPPATNSALTADIPDTFAQQGIQNQKPLPVVNLGFTPRYPLSIPGKLPPSTRAQISSTPVRGGAFPFAFGSQYDVAPKTFDFDGWSKKSSAARFPQDLFFRGGLIRGREETGDKRVVGSERHAPEGKGFQSRSEQPGEDSSQHILAEKASLSLEHDSDSAKTPDMANNGYEENSTLMLEATQEPLDGESPMPKAEFENISQPPQTPITSIQHWANTGLLTPEATPEPQEVNFTLGAKEDKPAPDSEPLESLVKVQTRQDSSGIATLVSERRYKTRLSSGPVNGPLTPPESPQASLRLSSGVGPLFEASPETSTPSLVGGSEARPSATIPRKSLPTPLPSKQLQDEVEWETTRTNARSRPAFSRRLRIGAAKKVTEMKRKTLTGVTKVMDSIVARLEPEETTE